MCGRFALTATTKEIEKLRYNLKSEYDLKPNINISPTMEIHVITNEISNELTKARWGLIPSWSKDITIGNKLFNARSETIDEKPSFKNSFKSKRCIIPATSFFEWKSEEASKKKLKFEITVADSKIFFFAGLWSVWLDEKKNKITSTTILTCEPNQKMSEIHNRMPVILDLEEQDLWLSETKDYIELKSLLKSLDNDRIVIQPF